MYRNRDARRPIGLLAGMCWVPPAFGETRPSAPEFRASAFARRTKLVGMRQDAIFAGMLKIAHHLLLVIIAFALVGGSSVQLAQSARFAASTALGGMPCARMMPVADAAAGQTMADDGLGAPMAPCRGMIPDCLKQMGCITDVGFPARLTVTEFSVPSIQVSYWHSRSSMAGLDRIPEPMPPRTI